MSSLVNKVKEALHSDKSSEPEGTHGPHSSRTANAADPRVDSDRDHRAALGANDGTYTSGDNYAIGGAQGGNRTTGPATGTDGPHSSNLANKVDPRVDSDRDYSRNMGMNPHGTATTGTTGTTGTTHGTTTGAFGSTGPSSGTAGPHSSNLANKADPRVDSDLDGSRNMGLNSGNNTTTGTTGTGSAFSTGATRNTGTFGSTGTRHTGVPEGTAGPHSSRIANAADPRVDSDLDSGRNAGVTGTHVGTGAYGTTGTHGTTTTHHHHGGVGTTAATGTAGLGAAGATHGTHGTHGTHTSGVPEGTAGPHNSRIANAADPRVDSDLDSGRNAGLHSGAHTSTHTGGLGTTGTTGSTTGAGGIAATGPAPNTAGPHKSDMLNKVDPRVDSDLDGSKTVGGNQTFNQSSTTGVAKDPTDAAQVPPSVLQKHIGAPTIHHGDDKHDRLRRHSISQQEQHRGL